MMALKALRLVLFLVWWDSAASSNAQFGQPSEYSTPNCHHYTLPGCPRDFNPVCGSDLSTYPNECTLCMKISAACRKTGYEFFLDELFAEGPCYEDLDCVNRQEHSVQVEKGEESGMKIAKPWASEKHGYGSTS
ncbi:hypothetical protein MJG53_005871 [Ovis ammon polii x Ovis aries]|uniref:Serine protease inhibitor Kazal-type 1 n=2 Tax=Ovis TaxID=9935 RepID=A0A836A707_SHEEP|nr:hypothetical protein JEQ12_017435 [Ovis aries]KAI4585637.1 hypothetical protein MJG53_005871 [Ovis ammon polii x Ovis aries]